jgi:hypothetical protein
MLTRTKPGLTIVDLGILIMIKKLQDKQTAFFRIYY